MQESTSLLNDLEYLFLLYQFFLRPMFFLSTLKEFFKSTFSLCMCAPFFTGFISPLLCIPGGEGLHAETCRRSAHAACINKGEPRKKSNTKSEDQRSLARFVFSCLGPTMHHPTGGAVARRTITPPPDCRFIHHPIRSQNYFCVSSGANSKNESSPVCLKDRRPCPDWFTTRGREGFSKIEDRR